MKLYIPVILTILLSGSLYGEEHHHHDMSTNQQDVSSISAYGTIKAIAEDHQSIRIFHEPIAELKWPAMNMKFELQNHELIHPFAVGDKVHFEFIRQGSSNIVTKIER